MCFGANNLVENGIMETKQLKGYLNKKEPILFSWFVPQTNL